MHSLPCAPLPAPGPALTARVPSGSRRATSSTTLAGRIRVLRVPRPSPPPQPRPPEAQVSRGSGVSGQI